MPTVRLSSAQVTMIQEELHRYQRNSGEDRWSGGWREPLVPLKTATEELVDSIISIVLPEPPELQRITNDPTTWPF